MANYNLTNQEIDNTFEQLLQKNADTGYLVDGSGSVVTDITIDGTLSSSFVGDGSGLTNLPTQDLPSGVISGSSQLDGTTIDSLVLSSPSITSAVASGSFNGIFVGDGSELTGITASAVIPSGTVSGSSQIDYPLISNIPSGIISSSEQLPSGIISSSEQLPSGLVSSSTQVEELLPSGVVSGSSQVSYPELSNIPSGILSSSAQVVLEDTTFTDGEADMFLETDGNGNIIFDWVKTLHQNIHNAEGTTIVKGTPLYISGSTGDNANVYIADAGNPLRRPATLIAYDATLNAGETGTAIISGEIQGVDTTLYSEGTIIYLGVGGGWSATRPSGSDNLVQALGIITRQANNGRGIVFNQLGNTLPNIQEGYVWVGDGNGVPQQFTTESVVEHIFTQDNTFTGTQTFNNIAVNGTGSFAYLQSITGSVKIIGDAFIILNNDTPTERYAGIAVQDSGSAGVTASLQFDGLTNDWFYEYSDDGGVTTDHGVALFGPEYNTIGTPTYPTLNTIQKGNGGHHLLDSNITDDGSVISLSTDTEIGGNLEMIGAGQIILIPNGTVEAGEIASPLLLVDTIEPNTVTTITLQGDTIISGNLEMAPNTLIVARVVDASSEMATPLFLVDSIEPNTGTSIQLNGSTEITASAADSQGFKVWDGSYTDGGEPFPILQVYSANDRAASGTAVEVNGGTLYANGLSAEPLEADTYPLFVTDAVEPRLIVNSQNASTAEGVNIKINGITEISGNELLVTSNEIFLEGNTTFIGSIKSEVGNITIASLTASVDFSQKQMQTLTLPTSGNTHIIASNVGDGQVVNLLVKQTGLGTVTLDSTILQPSGSSYQATSVTDARDILTFTTFDNSTTSETYLVNVVNLV